LPPFGRSTIRPAPRSQPSRAQHRLGQLRPPRRARHAAPDVVVVYARASSSATLACVATPSTTTPELSWVPRPERRLLGPQPARPRPAGVAAHLVARASTPARCSTNRPLTSPADNIATYQHRQMATALPLLIRAVEDALSCRLAPHRVALPPANGSTDTVATCAPACARACGELPPCPSAWERAG
jgi:hypothetical protein